MSSLSLDLCLYVSLCLYFSLLCFSLSSLCLVPDISWAMGPLWVYNLAWDTDPPRGSSPQQTLRQVALHLIPCGHIHVPSGLTGSLHLCPTEKHIYTAKQGHWDKSPLWGTFCPFGVADKAVSGVQVSASPISECPSQAWTMLGEEVCPYSGASPAEPGLAACANSKLNFVDSALAKVHHCLSPQRRPAGWGATTEAWGGHSSCHLSPCTWDAAPTSVHLLL